MCLLNCCICIIDISFMGFYRQLTWRTSERCFLSSGFLLLMRLVFRNRFWYLIWIALKKLNGLKNVFRVV